MRALIQHLEREHVERAAAQKTQLLAGGAAGATAGAAGGTAAATAAFPSSKRALPRAGDVLEVKTIVPEAGRKVYTYKGVCLGRASKGPRSWIKMYNVFPDAGGVVQHLPM
jgi:ribosomal protein L19